MIAFYQTSSTILSLLLLLQTRVLQTSVTISKFDSTYAVDLDENKLVKGVDISFSSSQLPLVRAYYGIRYASLGNSEDKTVTPRRFHNSVAPFIHEDRVGTLIKNRQPPVCPQNIPDLKKLSSKMPETTMGNLKRILPFLRKQNEDCLTMNIYVPKKTPASHSEPLLPVMVFVHGESYEFGSGNAYDPSVLASYGQLIAITLNYRLGILGFLATENGDPLGNIALFDLFASIQWIQTNIHRFGGDPNRVTLMGHGYGAALVNLFALSHLVEARNNNYGIHRLVLLSGVGLSPWATSQFFHSYTEKLANKLNTTQSLLSKRLRSMSVHDILELQRTTPEFRYASRLGPIITQHMFPDIDLNRCMTGAKGRRFSNFDILLGLTTNSGLGFISRDQIKRKLSRQEFEKSLRTFVRQNFVYEQQKIYEVLDHFYTDWSKEDIAPKPDAEMARLNGLVNLLSDAFFVAPTIRTAQLHARMSEGARKYQSRRRQRNRHNTLDPAGRTFLYLFSHKSHTRHSLDFSKAVFGDDLRYLFGAPVVDPDRIQPFPNRYSQVEKMLSEALMRYLSNFVKSGDPNRPLNHTSYWSYPLGNRFKNIIWPEYKPMSEEYLKIDQSPQMGRSIRTHYRSQQSALWNQLIPRLHTPNNRSARNHQLRGYENVSLFEENSLFFEKWAKFSTPSIYAWVPPTTTSPPSPIIKYRPQETAKLDLSEKYGSNIDGSSNQSIDSQRAALVWTVAAGCALLVLNVLVFVGIYYQAGRLKTQRQEAALDKTAYSKQAGSVVASPTIMATVGTTEQIRSGHKMLHSNVNYSTLNQSEYPMMTTLPSSKLAASTSPNYRNWSLPRGAGAYHDMQEDSQPITMV